MSIYLVPSRRQAVLTMRYKRQLMTLKQLLFGEKFLRWWLSFFIRNGSVRQACAQGGFNLAKFISNSMALKGHKLAREHRWITGPSFRSLPGTEWSLIPLNQDDISVEDLEVKRVVVHSMKITENYDMLSRLWRFSEWLLLKGIIARILPLKTRQRQVSSPRGQCSQGSTRT